MLASMFHAKRRRRASSAYSSCALDPPAADPNAYMSEAETSVDGGEGEYREEDKPRERATLLPIFSADLDSIPVYNLVHMIRSSVVSRVDTTLTWDQLRTPQVSSFVVKPILSSLIEMEDQLSKGVFYSLMANCLQFRKEAQENPANSGTSSTRAYLCELLAIKCLKEFTTRELIDALSYDFYPLQGMPPSITPSSTPLPGQTIRVVFPAPKPKASTSRISALEVAIRAQAKKFLSHPMVIQQLEAIWAGNIVFYSPHDQLLKAKGAGMTFGNGGHASFRRAAAIYDGRHASLFKLSRLRVPKYRYILSTISLTILLFLHLMVLRQRSHAITPLEIVFWLWSSGFMIDELTDINESGVTLYFMSLWNSFDIGIFLFFVTFYFMRILGLVLHDKQHITDWSFEILASCSIFLFPRIFSVLDHYRYFSQLIIAFRIMAVDMLSLLVMIVVSCSGFFVAFTFSFAKVQSASDVSYALFQILMGFTPAAWETWDEYNLLGKFLLSGFLIICHFLIVTILITVLTNSFAAVAANAQEEHQFLTAVNTISLVKHEALFTYIAPSNLIAWLLAPIRYLVSFRRYVRLNRTIVKATHWPILAVIYGYERTIMRNSIYTPSDVVTTQKSSRPTLNALRKPEGNDRGLLSPFVRKLRRKESIGSHQQERALEEVFRKPFRGPAGGPAGGDSGMLNTGAVDSWVNGVLSASPPESDALGTLRKHSRPRRGRGRGYSFRNYGSIQQRSVHCSPPPHARDISMTRSVISDPEDFAAATGADKYGMSDSEFQIGIRTEDDADNEANSEEEETNEEGEGREKDDDDDDDDAESHRIQLDPLGLLYAFEHPGGPSPSNKARADGTVQGGPGRRPSRHHSRTNSSNTILLRPQRPDVLSDTDDSIQLARAATPRRSGQRTPETKTPRPRPQVMTTKPRPISFPRIGFQSVPDRDQALLGLDGYGRRRSASGISDLVEEMGLDKNIGLISSSFATQMAMATGRDGDPTLNRLVLARIKSLEDSVKDVKEILKEVKKLKKEDRKSGQFLG